MKQVARFIMSMALVAGVVLVAIGCNPANPDDKETMALARDFTTAVFVTRDPAAAMAMVVPITGFGYVTKDAIDSTILNDRQKKCTTDPTSVQAGPPGSNLSAPAVSDADRAKGITDRVLWIVSYNYRCGSQAQDSNRSTQVYLEKVNGKWGISKCTF
jgi:hypothetical protein